MIKSSSKKITIARNIASKEHLVERALDIHSRAMDIKSLHENLKSNRHSRNKIKSKRKHK